MFHELEASIGRTLPLDVFHGAVRRAAQEVRGVRAHGVMLVTCSDEFQGEARSAFERDVSRPLMATVTIGSRRTFAVSNLGGRVEPGALRLADEHFTTIGRSPKMLVVEIAAHCGVITDGHARTYGRLRRFGAVSDCCGALAMLIDSHAATNVVRHPWYDQLGAFFGPERLAALRADTSPLRALKTAIVHGILQGESSIADLLREGSPTPTHVLLVVVVVLNRAGGDEALPVAFHHLHSDGSEVRIVHGASLRSSPDALRFGEREGGMYVTSDEEPRSTTSSRVPQGQRAEFSAFLSRVQNAQGAAAVTRAAKVEDHLGSARRQVEHLRGKPNTWRVYARPLLRGLVQTVSMVAPEVGLAVMLLQSGHDAARAKHLKHLLEHGPRSEEAQLALKRLEAEIQQLSHRDAQDVLELLVSEAGARAPIV